MLFGNMTKEQMAELNRMVEEDMRMLESAYGAPEDANAYDAAEIAEIRSRHAASSMRCTALAQAITNEIHKGMISMREARRLARMELKVGSYWFTNDPTLMYVSRTRVVDGVSTRFGWMPERVKSYADAYEWCAEQLRPMPTFNGYTVARGDIRFHKNPNGRFSFIHTF